MDRLRKKYSLACFFAVMGTIMVFIGTPVELIGMYVGLMTPILGIFSIADVMEKNRA